MNSTSALANYDQRTRRNHKVLLREQVFQDLRLLLEREGKIVTREEIKGRLWPDDTVVDFDRSINATINTLLRALGIPPIILETLRPWRGVAIDLWSRSSTGSQPQKLSWRSQTR